MDSYFAGSKELNFMNPETQLVFRRLIEDIRTPVFMADSHNNLFYVNHAFCELVEVTSASLALGHAWSEMLLPDQPSRKVLFDRLDQSGFVKDFETAFTTSYGRKNVVLLTAHLLFNDQRERIGISGFVLDISERHKMEARLALEQEKLKEILHFSQFVSDVLNDDEVTDYIVNQTAKILNVKRCSLMLLDPGTNSLFTRASFGFDKTITKDTQVKIGTPVSGIVALQNQPILVEDITTNPLLLQPNKAAYSKPSFLSAPLLYKDQLIGMINVSERETPFNSLDLMILDTLAQQAAINIHRAQTLHQLKTLSQIDPLTELFNRRTIMEKLQEEINRSSRYATPFTLMMIDVDNFKLLNDRKGHLEGDALLQNLAKLFRIRLRNTDIIGRYGGDEFCAILPQTDTAQAAVVAESLRITVAEEFSADAISLSIGLAQHLPGLSLEQTISLADQALYEVKRSGRNRVCISPAPANDTPPHA